MAGKLTFRAPTDEDVAELAAKLRRSDRREIALLAPGRSGLDVLRQSVAVSDPGMLFSVFADGELMCIFGCSGYSLMSRVGVPWMMGTDVITRNGKSVTREAIRLSRIMLERWPILVNIIDAGNVRTIAWLKRVGFRFFGPFPHGDGMVYRFEMRAEDV